MGKGSIDGVMEEYIKVNGIKDKSWKTNNKNDFNIK